MKEIIKEVRVWDDARLRYKIVPMRLYCVICGSLIPRRRKWMGRKLYNQLHLNNRFCGIKLHFNNRGPQGVTCSNKCLYENTRRARNKANRKWHLNHPEARLREYPHKLEYMKEYYQENKDIIKEKHRLYEIEYNKRPWVKQHRIEYRRQWQRDNKDKVKMYNQRAREKKKLLNISLTSHIQLNYGGPFLFNYSKDKQNNPRIIADMHNC
jgi:hypothetical protein